MMMTCIAIVSVRPLSPPCALSSDFESIFCPMFDVDNLSTAHLPRRFISSSSSHPIIAMRQTLVSSSPMAVLFARKNMQNCNKIRSRVHCISDHNIGGPPAPCN